MTLEEYQRQRKARNRKVWIFLARTHPAKDEQAYR
jgi:hypothetical protein